MQWTVKRREYLLMVVQHMNTTYAIINPGAR
jgi:hypothetical protein